MPAKIGIVTVTYNSAEVLDDFLISIKNQSMASWILYAIDNASRDQTVDKIQRFSKQYTDCPIVIVTNQQNVGVAEGNNQGIARALCDQCTHVLLINNDTVFGPDLLQGLLDGLDKNHCQMVVPKIMYHDQQSLIWCAGGFFLKHSPSWVDHYGRNQDARLSEIRSKEVNYAPTCCLIAQSEVFHTIGTMDKQYFVYYDDVDFCYRAWMHGFRMFYLADVKLFHKVSKLTGGESSPFSIRYTMRNRVYFIRKNFKTPHRELGLLFNFLWMWAALLRRREIERFKIRWHAFYEGLSLNISQS